MHQASIPQIVFAQNPSEQSECAGNLSEEGGWGFSAPCPTASSISTYFLASVTFSFHGKPFLLQWGLFSLGSQPCSVSDQHPDPLHGLCFPFVSSTEHQSNQGTQSHSPDKAAGRGWEGTRNAKEHTYMHVRAHTQKVLCYILFKNLKLEASFAAQFCHLIIWPGRSYYIFPSLFLIYLSCKVVMGMDRGYIEHSTETGFLYYWTRLCAYQGMNNFLTNLLFHY